MILVSACLMGKNCKYSGGNNRNAKVAEFLKDKEYILFCPETLGNLPIPREPVELINGKAINKAGEDVSAAFIRGADISAELCLKYQPEIIILKEASPSCGVHKIYDGSFSHTKIDGCGCTAQRLQNMGYKIISEEDL